MATRTMRLRHQEDVRNKIKTSMLINRLEAHADNKVELSPTQVSAIKILLGKVLPDLTAISGDPEGGPLRGEVTVRFTDKP